MQTTYPSVYMPNNHLILTRLYFGISNAKDLLSCLDGTPSNGRRSSFQMARHNYKYLLLEQVKIFKSLKRVA